MKVRLTSLAELDAWMARSWYESKSARLGEHFVAELAVAFDNLEQFPLAWHPLGDGVRRYRLDRFPYGVFYVIVLDECVVFAIDHLRRHPQHWRKRLSAVETE